MELMNYLGPDVVTLGNHEMDYGLPHLLFLEKLANFPIVNANLYIKKYHKRLMRPYLILNVDGFDILFIGIITEMALQSIRMEDHIGTFVGLEDAASEVGKICNTYKDADIDLTILLTHIGFEEDKKLAAMLDPEWGVDLIIGGHSHTILEQPAEINDILIAQAGVGTDQIGRFDILVDDDTNAIVEWTWELIPITSELSEPDEDFERFISSFQDTVDQKYNAILSRFVRKLTHPTRYEETELGNLVADIIAERSGVDVVLVGSGSLRGTELGALVTLGDLRTMLPYGDPLHKLCVTGAQLKRIFYFYLEPQVDDIFQVNRGVQAVYIRASNELESLTIDGKPVHDDEHYDICLKPYFIQNAPDWVGLTVEELTALKGEQVIATSNFDIIEEYLRQHQHVDSRIEGRLVFR